MNRRRLDAELVRRGLADSRTAAQRLVEEGLVEVGGNPTPKAATQVHGGTSIRVVAALHPFVSRGGMKLDAALDRFGVDVAGARCVDVGASTGGFTDCLLRRGAATVAAVDVGYGQLAERLRSDDRVTVVDRTNVRTADPSDLGAPFDVVVADLSFISLCTVAGALASLGGNAATWVLLVKPQFEVGREEVGRGGIVRDPMLQRRAIADAVTCLSDAGITVTGAMPSPIVGAKGGNREYLVVGHRGGEPLDPASLDEVVA